MSGQAVSHAEPARAPAAAARISQSVSADTFLVGQPESVALRRQSEAMNAAPRLEAQRKIADAMNASPAVAAQRRLADRMAAKGTLSLAPADSAAVAQRRTIHEAFGKDLGELNRTELNAAIDDRTIDEPERISAEQQLRLFDQTRIAEIKAMIDGGDLAGALTAAARLVGVTDVDVLPTADYASVIPEGTDIPRGIPNGVTVPVAGEPTVYIHEYWIKKWASDDTIGNLLSTIVHEAKHAQQLRAGTPAADRGDAREFEAYEREITAAYGVARNFEESLLPDASHIQRSYEMAKTHYDAMNVDERGQYAGAMAEIERIAPPLIRHLERNDRTSGRTEGRVVRIRALVDQALETVTSEDFDRLYAEISRTVQTLPESEQAQFNSAMEQLQDHSRDLWRRRK